MWVISIEQYGLLPAVILYTIMYAWSIPKWLSHKAPVRKYERVLCKKCGCLILVREGQTKREVLRLHRLNKWDTVLRMITPEIPQETRELNPCYKVN